MKVKQLGNGGGLDFSQTNSAFLVELEKDNYLLVDCGFNIMPKLIELDKNQGEEFKLENLNFVYITHTHEDHIGNLSSLVYHRYFLLGGLNTGIIAHDYVWAELKHLLSNCGTELKSGKVVKADMFRRLLPREMGSIKHIDAYHAGVNCYGIYIGNPNGRAIYISGDTKAYEPIETKLRELSDNKLNDTLMFHDFSNWNSPSRNVHACQSDIDSEYSVEFAKELCHYHDGGVFDDSWIEL